MSRRKGIQEVPLYPECIGGAGWAKSEDRKWLSRNPHPQRWKWLNFTQKQSPAPVPSCSRSITYCPSSFLYQTLPVSGPCCSSSFTSCVRSFQLQHPSFLRPYFSGFWPVASGPSQPSLANTHHPPPTRCHSWKQFCCQTCSCIPHREGFIRNLHMSIPSKEEQTLACTAFKIRQTERKPHCSQRTG